MTNKDLEQLAVVIPTYNAIKHGSEFVDNLKILAQANLLAILVIDSSSEDETVNVSRLYGCLVQVINKQDFNHGGTRNLALSALEQLKPQYVLYMTQDAVLQSVNDLHSLLMFSKTNNLSGCYARQIAHQNANLMARHLREFNYRKDSYVATIADKSSYGMKLIFNSNSCAIYNYQDLLAVGGFPADVIMSEDSYVFAKLVKQGKSIGYCASAICYHSHNYSVWQDFRRYFDIGVFQVVNGALIDEFGYIRHEGKRFMWSEIKYISKHNFLYLPRSLTHTLAKIIGFMCGRNYKILGLKLSKKLSMHRRWWKSTYFD